MKYETKKTEYGEIITCIPETEQEIKEQKEHEEWVKYHWCDNENHEDAYYVPDNVHPALDKHHWRCKSCHLIKQVG